jgi:glycosyltransferase involved in cell wall biosynthesis
MPLVSVIIPVYNSHQFLQEAIDSVLNQTFKDYEVIVVNDGSTNGETLNFLNNLPPSISVIHKENGGLASARNYGIRHSKGEIILTLDSDDKFASTFLNEAVEILSEKNEVGVVSSYVKEFGDSSKTWRTTAFDDFSFLTENRIVSCCAFRKKCWVEVNGYDEQMRSGYEDWEFWIRVTQKGWKVHVIPKTLFFYRKSSTSMLASETKPRLDTILSYMVSKHQDWFVEGLKKGIKDKTLINKKNLTTRRILGLFIEKITGKF